MRFLYSNLFLKTRLLDILYWFTLSFTSRWHCNNITVLSKILSKTINFGTMTNNILLKIQVIPVTEYHRRLLYSTIIRIIFWKSRVNQRRNAHLKPDEFLKIVNIYAYSCRYIRKCGWSKLVLQALKKASWLSLWHLAFVCQWPICFVLTITILLLEEAESKGGGWTENMSSV